MKQALLFLLLVLLSPLTAFTQDVLIVADEFPAMEILARQLKQAEGIASKIVSQTNLPQGFSAYKAVVVYIHLKLHPTAEHAFINYTQQGGKLIVLHHSISSGKRNNEKWFSFLGVELPTGPVEQGGYKWIEPATVQWVNLDQKHYITSHKVEYAEKIEYKSEQLPGFTLHHSEAYINHVITEPRQILLGIKYLDEKSGKVYMQDRAGWLRKQGKGLIVYLMPGHSSADFENKAFSQMVINSVTYSEPQK